MSEARSEEHPEEESGGTVDAMPTAPTAARRRSSGATPWLAALLIVVVVGVALSPFWAPQIGALLPWGTKTAVTTDEHAALAARVAAIEQHPPATSANIEALKSTVTGLGQRVEQLEKTVTGRVATSTADADAIKSQLSGLTQRVERLETANGGGRQLESSVAAAKSALQNLDQRVAAVEAQSSRGASDTADLQKLGQEIARLGATATGLANRVGALEHEAQSQNIAELHSDAMLALLLVQIREAVAQGRPFPAEYSTFTTLARDPGLKAAAEPLAGAARSGVASHAVLVKRLAELAAGVATASEPASETDLGHKVLAHLRGLVTIRRIEDSPQTEPEAAVSAAQTALARGDLAAAVAALDTLTGANAEAAGPWLRMAHERLAVEAALDHLQQLLTVRLGSARPAPAAPPPAAPQVSPPEQARTPS